MVDDAVGLGLLRVHVVVPIGILLDLLGGLARVLGEDVVEGLAPAQDLARGDGDVGRLAAGAAVDVTGTGGRVMFYGTVK